MSNAVSGNSRAILTDAQILENVDSNIEFIKLFQNGSKDTELFKRTLAMLYPDRGLRVILNDITDGFVNLKTDLQVLSNIDSNFKFITLFQKTFNNEEFLKQTLMTLYPNRDLQAILTDIKEGFVNLETDSKRTATNKNIKGFQGLGIQKDR